MFSATLVEDLMTGTGASPSRRHSAVFKSRKSYRDLVLKSLSGRKRAKSNLNGNYTGMKTK